MRYRLIAVDLDGTLIGSDGRISQRNLDAIARAQQAGLIVAPCTGRAWCESQAVLADFPRCQDEQPGIFITGAAITDLNTGQSLDMAVIEPHLAMGLVESLSDMPDAVLIFRDAAVVGHDYLVTGQGTLTPNTQWWFSTFAANVRFQRSIGPEDLHHAMRVGMVAAGPRAEQAIRRIERFNSQVTMHSFEALPSPDPEKNIHILEIFAGGVDKWRGVSWLARNWGIDASQVVAIGDQINDVSMIRQAGCGVAMSNAVPQVKAVADQVTRSNDQDGVAWAIDQILSGRW